MTDDPRDDQAHRPDNKWNTEEGGDPACWLAGVCPDCGRFVGDEPPTTCPRCGAEITATDT